MATIDITNDNFDEVTERSPLLLLDFWAPWCGPCQGFAPYYEEASSRHPDVVFGKINTEAETTLAKQFEIFSVPTLMAVKDGTIFYARPGVIAPHKLEELIADLRAFVPEEEV